MTPSRLIGRLAAASGIAGLALSAGMASAAPQMFKCIVGGRTVYQQAACPAGADTEPAATSSSGSAASTSAATRRLKPASRPASSASATRP
jgi:hypothetical protein